MNESLTINEKHFILLYHPRLFVLAKHLQWFQHRIIKIGLKTDHTLSVT